MIKLEIIANKVLEEDIIDALDNSGYGENFTTVSPVYGRGRHGRREGSAIWPEENIMFIVYIKEAEYAALIDVLKRIKGDFPLEGLRCYAQTGTEKAV